MIVSWFDFLETDVQISVCLRKKIQNSLILLISDNINLAYFEIRKVENTKESRHRYAWLYAVIVCNAVMEKLGPSKNSFFRFPTTPKRYPRNGT